MAVTESDALLDEGTDEFDENRPKSPLCRMFPVDDESFDEFQVLYEEMRDHPLTRERLDELAQRLERGLGGLNENPEFEQLVAMVTELAERHPRGAELLEALQALAADDPKERAQRIAEEFRIHAEAQRRARRAAFG